MAGSEFKLADQPDGSLIIEGWVSTKSPDYIGDVIEPDAFAPVIQKYLQKPILLFMHNISDLPIGKTLALDIIPDKGLWGKVQILPTKDRGQDIITLVKNAVLNSFSFAFIPETTQPLDNGGRLVTKLKMLIEVSVVNLGMNEEAIFQIAKAKNLELKSFKNNPSPGGAAYPKGDHEMEPDAIKKEINAALTPIEVTVKEVKNEVATVAGLQKQLTDRLDRTESEKKEFVDKIFKDFTNAVQQLNEAIKANQSSKILYGNLNQSPYDIKQLMVMDDTRLKRVFTQEKFQNVDELRRMNDMLLLVDAMKIKSGDASYASLPREKRLQTLQSFKEFEVMAKAMDTATSNEGSQYLPVGYSSRLINMVRQNLVVAAMHPSFPMTEASQVLPVEGADTLATRAAQTTAVISAFNSTEQTPGSANVTFTAEKLRGRTQFSGEADEDLIVSMFDYISMKVSRSIARAVDKATISGDDAAGTSYDTGDIPGATDARYCWNGYRQLCQAANKVDLSTFSPTNLNALRAKCGKYAAAPQDWFWLTSLTTYLLRFLDPTQMKNVMTIDKYGPSAVVVTGELAKYMGASILQSEFVLDTYNAAGIYDGTTMTKSIVLCVNRSAFMYGIWKDLTMEIIRDAINDVYDIIAYHRLDFQPVFTASAEDIVSIGYDVATS